MVFGEIGLWLKLQFIGLRVFCKKSLPSFFFCYFGNAVSLRCLNPFQKRIHVLYLNKIFFSNYKMVILTLTTTENPHTVYFDQPIKNPSYIRLLRCSLYNSWFNLKEGGKIFYTDEKTLKNLNPFFQVITRSKKWQKQLKML